MIQKEKRGFGTRLVVTVVIALAAAAVVIIVFVAVTIIYMQKTVSAGIIACMCV